VVNFCGYCSQDLARADQRSTVEQKQIKKNEVAERENGNLGSASRKEENRAAGCWWRDGGTAVRGRKRLKRGEEEREGGEGGSRRTDRCQGNEGNLHFVKLSLGSSRARPEHGG